MKLKQLLLLSTLLFTSTTWTMGGARAKFFKWTPRITSGIALVTSCALPTYGLIINRNDNYLKSLTPTDASPCVEQFVRKKLHEQQVNSAENIKIMIQDKSNFLVLPELGVNVAAVSFLNGQQAILFGKPMAKSLDEALTNNNTLETQKIIKVQDTILNHEIGHLQDRYFKNLTYLSFATPFAAQGFIQICKKIINLSPAQTIPGLLFRCSASIVPSIIIRYALILSLKIPILHKLENNADAYAMHTTKDPEGLKLAASFIENITLRSLKDRWTPTDITNAKNYPNLSKMEQYRLKIKWLTMLPTHPFPFERAAKFRKAAQELEDKQNQEKKLVTGEVI